jgi:hypothetical protein
MKWVSAARIGFLVAAGLVSLRAVVELFEPRYWDPQSIVDYLSVAAMTVMLLACRWRLPCRPSACGGPG